MRSTRRSFLEQAAGCALLTQAGASLAAGDGKSRTGGDLLSRMSWLNPPASEHFDGGILTVRSKGKTDFWRKTFYGYITDNGHFMHLPILGEFTLQARVNGNYSALYDQAGRLGLVAQSLLVGPR